MFSLGSEVFDCHFVADCGLCVAVAILILLEWNVFYTVLSGTSFVKAMAWL